MSTLDQKLASAKSDRILHVFTLPAALQALGAKQIGIIELTAGEEIMATQRAANDQIRVAWELAKESLRMLDDQSLSTGDGTADKVWQDMHPKIRTLVISAYGKIHQPKAQELSGFLESHAIKVS